MRVRRCFPPVPLSVSLVLLVLLVPWISTGAEWQDGVAKINDDLSLGKISDTILRHVSWHHFPDFGRVPANGLVVISGQEAALIDTPWTDELTSALIRWLSQELGVRVSTVVATHYHDDCAGGLAAAHQLGARSYALQLTAELAAEHGREQPQVTFAAEMTVDHGSLQLELLHPGPAHTPDNIVVYLRQMKILFGGCAVRSATSQGLGNTREADLQRWPDTIRRLQELYPDAELIVPGHGRPGGQELLQRTLELLAAEQDLDSPGKEGAGVRPQPS